MTPVDQLSLQLMPPSIALVQPSSRYIMMGIVDTSAMHHDHSAMLRNAMLLQRKKEFGHVRSLVNMLWA